MPWLASTLRCVTRHDASSASRHLSGSEPYGEVHRDASDKMITREIHFVFLSTCRVGSRLKIGKRKRKKNILPVVAAGWCTVEGYKAIY